MTRLATIIFSIPPYQIENETYFSLARTFTSSHCANLSINILGNILFINRNSDLWHLTPKTPPEILFAPLELLQDIFEDA